MTHIKSLHMQHSPAWGVWVLMPANSNLITEFLYRHLSNIFPTNTGRQVSITRILSSEIPGSLGRYDWRNWNRQINIRSEREMNYQPILATNTKMTKWVKTRSPAPPNQELHNLTSWTSVRSPANWSLESERRRDFSNRLRFDGPNVNPRLPIPVW